MNYTELVDAIKGYSENDFPDTVGTGSLTSAEQIAIFVQNAEERIYNSVQIPAIRKNMTGTTTSGNKYLSVPSDWLSTFSLAVVCNGPTTLPDGRVFASGDYLYLLNKDVNFIREAFPSQTDTGLPIYYAVFDYNTFILGPMPNSNYTVELHYFYYPPSIVTAGTSWLGDNFESALLYGSMLEAASFMKSDADVVKNYTDRYNEALSLLKMLGDAKDRQDAYRSGQVRYPVK
jgi:hypothetical protein